jgi:signal transduction histidine kinase
MKPQRATEKKSSSGAPAKELNSADSLLVHDIKNLSFRLGSLLQNLENHYEDPLFKKSVIEILSDTVQQMEKIVHRFPVRRGDLIVKYPVDVNEILNEIVERIPRTIQQTHFIEEAYERVPKVWADPKFLKEAFIILVENALQAMDEEGGILMLSTGVSVTRAGGKRVIVKISDTGCGMSKEFIREVLFTPFISTKEEGLGLGLYACKRIISQHDGSIRVTSQEGRGTTFRIALPGAG